MTQELQIHRFEVDLGEPKDVEVLICPHDNLQVPYIDTNFTYRRYIKQGVILEASVRAHVCEGCNSHYYLEDDSEKIDYSLLEKLYDLGLKQRPKE